MTFVEACRRGKIPRSKWNKRVDDWVDRWHESDSKLSLNEFLGLTRDEYSRFLFLPSALTEIIDAKLAAVAAKRV